MQNCRHGEDYTLYYSNIRDNVTKRTEAFKRVESSYLR